MKSKHFAFPGRKLQPLLFVATFCFRTEAGFRGRFLIAWEVLVLSRCKINARFRTHASSDAFVVLQARQLRALDSVSVHELQVMTQLSI